MWWAFPVAAVVGYVLGSLPMGLIAGKLARGIDIRDFGSGKTGFTNALRTLGLKAALPVLLGDFVKGAAPVLIARLLGNVADLTDPHAFLQMTAGLAAIVGHDWPLFAGFRGGRGVTTFFGVMAGMNPLVVLAMVPVGVGIVVVTRYMSVMSIASAVIAALALIGLAAADVLPLAYAIYASLGAALIVVLHRENIERLLAGNEPKIGHGGERRAAPDGRATSSRLGVQPPPDDPTEASGTDG